MAVGNVLQNLKNERVVGAFGFASFKGVSAFVLVFFLSAKLEKRKAGVGSYKG